MVAPSPYRDKGFRRGRSPTAILLTTTGCGIGLPSPDLIIAETALFHGLGVVHVDADFDRIAEVRPLTARRRN